MTSRNMCLLPRATLHSNSEQFIYNWMLEDDLDLDWGNRKEAKWTRGKTDNPVSHARSRSAKKAQRTKGIYANQSRDVDSRKLFLSVMLDRGQQRRLRKQTGIVMQTKLWCGFTRTKTLSVVPDQGRQKGLRYKRHLCKSDGYTRRTESRACKV